MAGNSVLWMIAICPECGSRQLWLYDAEMATPAPLHCQHGHGVRKCEFIEAVSLDAVLAALLGAGLDAEGRKVWLHEGSPSRSSRIANGELPNVLMEAVSYLDSSAT